MLNLISAVIVFGKVKGATILFQKNVEPETAKRQEPEAKGFWGILSTSVKKICGFVSGVVEKLEYEIVQANIESYTNASEEYKAEILKILSECDGKLQSLEEKYEAVDSASSEE